MKNEALNSILKKIDRLCKNNLVGNYSSILYYEEALELKLYIERLKKKADIIQDYAMEWKVKYEMLLNGESSEEIESLLGLKNGQI